jgi:hypothetical protein
MMCANSLWPISTIGFGQSRFPLATSCRPLRDDYLQDVAPTLRVFEEVMTNLSAADMSRFSPFARPGS